MSHENGCDLCAAYRRIEDLHKKLDFARMEIRAAKADVRDWQERANYFRRKAGIEEDLPVG